MKILFFGIITFLSLNCDSLHAQTEQVLDSEVINVDGYVKEEAAPQDEELKTIHTEIKRQKTEIILNKEKAKNFKTLAKSTEKLSETTEEYLEEKKAVQAQIAEYNQKVKCLQEEYPGKECDKFLRRR